MNANEDDSDPTLQGTRWSSILLPSDVPLDRDMPPTEVVSEGSAVTLRLRPGIGHLLPAVGVFAGVYSLFALVFFLPLHSQGQTHFGLVIAGAVVGFGLLMTVVMLFASPRAYSTTVLWSSDRAFGVCGPSQHETLPADARIERIRVVRCWVPYGNTDAYPFHQLQVLLSRGGSEEWMLVCQATRNLMADGRALGASFGLWCDFLVIEPTQGVTREKWRQFCEAGSKLTTP